MPDHFDPLFDTSDRGLAETFGRRAVRLMALGHDPFQAARLAFSFAFKVRPSLRDLADRPRLTLAASDGERV